MDFDFISGNVSLDFVGTLENRATTRHEVLRSTHALAEWVKAARLVTRPINVQLKDLEAAIKLREAIYDLTVAYLAKKPPKQSDLAIVNDACKADRSQPGLKAFGKVHREESMATALATIARAAIELLGGDDRQFVRYCQGIDCMRLFVDKSSLKNRRWCEMKMCGNQAKVAAYRRRQQ